MLLARPEAVKNPFYMMAPDWALLPLVVLATVSHMSTKTLIFAGGAKARDGLRGRAEAGEIAFGTIDSWLL